MRAATHYASTRRRIEGVFCMFSGSIPALVTPFRDGKLDEDAFRALVDWQITENSAALVPCGTSGASATMSIEEHNLVAENCVEQAGGRFPVIAGHSEHSPGGKECVRTG